VEELQMTKSEAVAEVFLTAFKALSRAERGKVLSGIVEDNRLRHDLMDMAVIEERRSEKERPFREYLKEHHSKERRGK
jgi:hypothetical protein